MFLLEDWLRERGASTNQVLASIGTLSKSDAVIAYCSAMDGLGTAKSDLDVYVLCDKVPTAGDTGFFNERLGTITQRTTIESLVLDVEFWPWSATEAVIKHLRPNDLTLSEVEMSFLARLLSGACLWGDQECENLRELIHAANMTDYAVNYYLLLSNSDLEDALAFFDEGDYRSALYPATNAFYYAMGANNAKNGISIFKTKWITKIFLENGSKRFIQAYHDAIIHPLHQDNIGERVESLIRFAQDLNSASVSAFDYEE